MSALVALLLHVLPPALVAAPDGGFQVGIGGRSWQLARKFEDDAGFSPLQFEVDGGSFTAFPLRQGCDARGCTYAAPGIFVARGISATSPSVGVRLEAISLDNFDMRVGFVEAQADGGLECLQLLRDQHPLADPYVGGWGCDGIAMHLTVGPSQTDLQGLTLVPASGALREQLRTSFAARAGAAQSVGVGFPIALSWSFLRVSASKTEFKVVLGSKAFAVIFDDAEFTTAPNSDGVPFEGGVLDTTRLVPILYIGWGGFYTPSDTGTMAFSLEGRGLDVTATRRGAREFAIGVQLVDQGGLALSAGESVSVSLEGNALAPVTLDGGVAEFNVTLPGNGAFVLELQSTEDQWVRGQIELTSLAGFDAGTVPDAGEPADAGDLSDAGVDAGVDGPPTARALRVGCGCQQLDGALAFVALSLLVRGRRVRAQL